MVGKSYIDVSWVYTLSYFRFKENIKLVTSRNYYISCCPRSNNFYIIVWNQFSNILPAIFFLPKSKSNSNNSLQDSMSLLQQFRFKSNYNNVFDYYNRGKVHESGVRVNAPLAKRVQKVGNDQHVKQFRRVRVFDDVTNAIPLPPSSS